MRPAVIRHVIRDDYVKVRDIVLQDRERAHIHVRPVIHAVCGAVPRQLVAVGRRSHLGLGSCGFERSRFARRKAAHAAFGSERRPVVQPGRTGCLDGKLCRQDLELAHHRARIVARARHHRTSSAGIRRIACNRYVVVGFGQGRSGACTRFHIGYLDVGFRDGMCAAVVHHRLDLAHGHARCIAKRSRRNRQRARGERHVVVGGFAAGSRNFALVRARIKIREPIRARNRGSGGEHAGHGIKRSHSRIRLPIGGQAGVIRKRICGFRSAVHARCIGCRNHDVALGNLHRGSRQRKPIVCQVIRGACATSACAGRAPGDLDDSRARRRRRIQRLRCKRVAYANGFSVRGVADRKHVAGRIGRDGTVHDARLRCAARFIHQLRRNGDLFFGNVDLDDRLDRFIQIARAVRQRDFHKSAAGMLDRNVALVVDGNDRLLSVIDDLVRPHVMIGSGDGLGGKLEVGIAIRLAVR